MEQEVRRLKRLFKDPNPLFTAWLTEWREEADKKDSKMKFVYGVALKSLRQYPLPLTSGKSCNILKGFGVTLCARLDERLQQHIDEHGPLPAIGIEDQVEIARQKPKAPARKRTPKPKPAASAPGPEPQLAETPPDGSPPRKGGRKSGEYRPKPGSGGFALLVALRRHEQKIATPGGSLRKTALQEAAQPLCNASMTLPDAGGYYTAWSTMSTLVKRKLVLREGNPARFSLTAAGREVADRLESSPWSVPSRRDCFDRLDGAGASPPDRSPDRPSLYGGGTGVAGTAGTDKRNSGFGTGAFSVPYASTASAPTTTSAPAAAGATFSYQYVSESGGAVSHKDDALVSLSSGNVGFLVRCRPAALRSSGRTYWPDDSRPERDGLVHVYLADSDCAEVCPGLESLPGSATLPRGVTGPTTAPTAAAAPVRHGPAAPVRHGRLHEMSDSDSEDEPMITAQTPPQSQRVPQSRLLSNSQSPSQSQSLSISQSLSSSQSQSQSQSASQSAPQSQRRPLPVGASLKRQPTDWSAALKRLRADSQAEACPSAAASTPSSAASVASSTSRGALSSAAAAMELSDEDCHLLSDDDDDEQQQKQRQQNQQADDKQSQQQHHDDDDEQQQHQHQHDEDDSDDDVIITAADIPAPRQPMVEDEFDDVPFTQSIRPPMSLSPVALGGGSAIPAGTVAGLGTGAGTGTTPPSAAGRLGNTGSACVTPSGSTTEAPGGSTSTAALMRERAAAAAEARLGRRPPPPPAPPATTQAAAASHGYRPVAPSSAACLPTLPKDTYRPSSSLSSSSSSLGSSAAAAASVKGPIVSSYRPTPKPPAPSLPARPPTDTLDFTPSVVLQPGTFDVMLCVDNQETSGKSGPGACLRTYRDVVLAELQKNGVVADVRKLSVGDFLWVARARVGSQPEELVLPYIVERKRLDDLASSIRDSRYREQKFRLKRCGVPNVIYLAEAMGTGPRAKAVGLPEATLQQALANCQVVDGFRVKWTADQRETAAFLTLMTRRLQRRYQYRQLEGYPRELLPTSPSPVGQPERLQLFSEFHQLSAKRKRLTVTDAFAKMLLQLSGLSVDKAAAIVAAYPTPAGLLEAYGRCGSKAEGEALLATLRAERSGRPVGAAVSKAVYHLYCDPQLA